LLGTYGQDENMSAPPEGRGLFMHQWSQNKHSSPCYFELWLGLVVAPFSPAVLVLSILCFCVWIFPWFHL